MGRPPRYQLMEEWHRVQTAQAAESGDSARKSGKRLNEGVTAMAMSRPWRGQRRKREKQQDERKLQSERGEVAQVRKPERRLKNMVHHQSADSGTIYDT